MNRPLPSASPPQDVHSIWTSRRWFLLATAALYAVGAGVLYFVLDDRTLHRVLALPLSVCAALLGLSLVNYVMRAWRWIILSRYLGFHVPVVHNLLYYLAGYSLTATPGKAGEAVRLWFLHAGHGIAYRRSVALMLADRIIDVWAVMVLIALSFSNFTAYLWQGVAVVVAVTLLSVPILYPTSLRPALGALAQWLPSRRRLAVRLRRVLSSMQELSSWRTYGVTLVPSAIGWFAEGFSLYLALRYFGAEVVPLDAVFVFAFSMVVGALSMLPGGLGSTEVTAVLLLRGLGVDLDVAIASTAIMRITTFWFAVAIGVGLLPAAIGVATSSAARASANAAPRQHAAT